MYSDEVVGLLQDLLMIPSFVDEARGVNENKVVEFIENWVRSNTDLQVEKQELPGERYNLILKKGNPEVLFLGHTDTVQPSTNAPVDQLSGKIIDGEIWGRGATDMKSGVAALLSAAKLDNKANNYWIVLYADEEYDFLGMREFVKKYGDIRPRLIVSADGSDLALGHGCRGLIEFTARVRGETGHPAKGTGNNAIWGSTLGLTKLREYVESFSHPVMGNTSFNLAYILGGAEVEKSVAETNRLSVVGKAGNVVADICEFTVDIRPAKPEISSEMIISYLKNNLANIGLEFELVELKHDLGAWFTDNSELEEYSKVANEVLKNVEFSDPRKTGYLDLQMLWDAVGRPISFMFGGGIGSTAHKPDERIKIKDLIAERDFFAKVFQKIAG